MLPCGFFLIHLVCWNQLACVGLFFSFRGNCSSCRFSESMGGGESRSSYVTIFSHTSPASFNWYIITLTPKVMIDIVGIIAIIFVTVFYLLPCSYFCLPLFLLFVILVEPFVIYDAIFCSFLTHQLYFFVYFF